MRRKDREVTDINKVYELLERGQIIRLALAEKYILPLCYGYEKKDDSFVLFFHIGRKGRKNELLALDNEVGFEIEGRFELSQSDIACRYSIKFESIIGLGNVIKLDDDEKVKGLNCIMNHIGGEKEWKYLEPILAITDVYKIEVKQFECKSNIK